MKTLFVTDNNADMRHGYSVSIQTNVVMHVGTNNQRRQYSMNEKQLTVVEKEKVLGVLLSNNLKFNEHIDKMVSKANSILGLIKRTFHHWTKEGFSMVYRTYVRPHLEYAVQAWSPQTRGNINKVEKVQRRATKLVPSIKHLSY